MPIAVSPGEAQVATEIAESIVLPKGVLNVDKPNRYVSSRSVTSMSIDKIHVELSTAAG